PRARLQRPGAAVGGAIVDAGLEVTSGLVRHLLPLRRRDRVAIDTGSWIVLLPSVISPTASSYEGDSNHQGIGGSQCFCCGRECSARKRRREGRQKWGRNSRPRA